MFSFFLFIYKNTTWLISCGCEKAYNTLGYKEDFILKRQNKVE